MAKYLIIENDHEQDEIPSELQYVSRKRFEGEREYWFSFYKAFWPENRPETIKRFMSLESGDTIICKTVFEDFQQLELMSKLLNSMIPLGKKLNIYILLYGLKEEIQRYLDESESDITPQTIEYDDSPELRKKFKQEMDKTLYNALEYHNLYEIGIHGDKDTLIKPENLTFKTYSPTNIPLKIMRITAGSYRTNVYSEIKNEEEDWTQVVEIHRSMDNNSQWDIEPLERGLKTKTECINLLKNALKEGVYNEFKLSTNKPED